MRAARRAPAGVTAPKTIGGCGFWTGFGSSETFSIVKKRPRCSSQGCVQAFL